MNKCLSDSLYDALMTWALGKPSDHSPAILFISQVLLQMFLTYFYTQPPQCLKADPGFAQVNYKYLRETRVCGGLGLQEPALLNQVLKIRMDF